MQELHDLILGGAQWALSLKHLPGRNDWLQMGKMRYEVAVRVR